MKNIWYIENIIKIIFFFKERPNLCLATQTRIHPLILSPGGEESGHIPSAKNLDPLVSTVQETLKPKLKVNICVYVYTYRLCVLCLCIHARIYTYVHTHIFSKTFPLRHHDSPGLIMGCGFYSDKMGNLLLNRVNAILDGFALFRIIP